MSEEEDLELQALQRQLDDAFQTTRPRRAFEDELWLRMQSRRPVWQRLREGLAGLIDGLREAPAVPSAAVAILLIALVGAGVFTLSGLHPGGGGSTAARDGGIGVPNTASQYGSLPVPAFGPNASRNTPSPRPPTVSLGGATSANPNVYFGPATLTWAGNLTVTTTNLPVYRYSEPTRAAADQFAASVGAAPATPAAPGALGTYSGNKFTLVVIGSTAQPAHEPSFNISEPKSASAPGDDPVAAGTAYLAAHSLIPTWHFQTEVQVDGSTVRVRFLRSFDVPALGEANLIDGVGDRYGIEVDLPAGNSSVLETGPLPVALDSANYPIISADQAIRVALASSASSTTATPYPVVRLTKAELVYTLVWAGDHSFYEPAFLFSGTFTDHGTMFVKRVLVPAVGPSFLSP